MLLRNHHGASAVTQWDRRCLGRHWDAGWTPGPAQWLRIRRCRICGTGCNWGSDLILHPGTPHATWGPKQKKGKKERIHPKIDGLKQQTLIISQFLGSESQEQLNQLPLTQLCPEAGTKVLAGLQSRPKAHLGEDSISKLPQVLGGCIQFLMSRWTEGLSALLPVDW